MERQEARTVSSAVQAIPGSACALPDGSQAAWEVLRKHSGSGAEASEVVKALDEICAIGNLFDEQGRVVGLWLSRAETPGAHLVEGVIRMDGNCPRAISATFGTTGSEPIRERALAAIEAAVAAPAKPKIDERANFSQQITWFGVLPNKWMQKTHDLSDSVISMRNLLTYSSVFSRDVIDKAIKAWMANAVGAFVATLDAEAIKFAARFPARQETWAATWISDAVWMGIDATFTPGAPLRRAIVAVPEHADVLSWEWEAGRTWTADQDVAVTLRNCLERRRSEKGYEYAGVSEVVTPVRKGLARRLVADSEAIVAACNHQFEQRSSMEMLNSFDFYRTGVTVGAATRSAMLLSRLPPEWIPRTPEDWMGAIGLSSALMTSEMRYRFGLQLSRFLNSGGRWFEFAERLVAATGHPEQGFAGVKPAIVDFGDLLKTFASQVMAPAVALSGGDLRRAETREAARALICSRRSLPRLLEIGALWHKLLPEFNASMEALPNLGLPVTAWRPGLPDWEFGGVRVSVLSDRRALVEEGQRGMNPDGSMGLDHCVSTYAPKCRKGAIRILSLRRATGGPPRRLSTAEVTWKKDDGFRAVQHRGVKNGPPPAECEGVLAAYFAALGSGTLKVDWEGLASMGDAGTVSETAGYEVAIPGNWNAVYALWGRLLPHSVRDWTPEMLAAFCAEDVTPEARLAAIKRGSFGSEDALQDAPSV